MVERGMLPPSIEHPLAKWLYKEFKAGSGTLTKAKAYEIGNELDALLSRIRMLEAAGSSLVRQVMGAKESLTKRPMKSVPVYPGSGEEPPDFKHTNWPYEDEE